MNIDCLPVLIHTRHPGPDNNVTFGSDAELEDLSIYLPRNLSYSEESYLSTLSLTTSHVHSPKKESYFRLNSELYINRKHVSDLLLDEMISTEDTFVFDSATHFPRIMAGTPLRKMAGVSKGQDTFSAGVDNGTYLLTEDEGYDVYNSSCDISVEERDRSLSLGSTASNSTMTSEEGVFDNDTTDDSFDSCNFIKSANTDVFCAAQSINNTNVENDLPATSEGCGAQDGLIETVSSTMQSLSLDTGDINTDRSTKNQSNSNQDIGVHEPCDGGHCAGDEHTRPEFTLHGEDEDENMCEIKTVRKSKSPPRLKLTACEQFSFDRSSQDGSQKSILELFEDSDSPLYEEEEFNFNKAGLRKSSSLKTNKTPPGTPHRKKIVRFADALGLDLESVRHVVNTDAPPKIPASAMKDLKVGLEEDRQSIGNRFLTACFQQPGASETFLQTVMAQKVCLENAVVTNLTITGVVRVANVGFHKFVRIRYSTNKWVTFHDIMGSYVQNSCDGPTDRFSFSLVAPADFGLHSRLECAISYTCADKTYWDNNNGANYVFECYAKTTPTTTEDTWMHFL